MRHTPPCDRLQFKSGAFHIHLKWARGQGGDPQAQARKFPLGPPPPHTHAPPPLHRKIDQNCQLRPPLLGGLPSWLPVGGRPQSAPLHRTRFPSCTDVSQSICPFWGNLSGPPARTSKQGGVFPHVQPPESTPPAGRAQVQSCQLQNTCLTTCGSARAFAPNSKDRVWKASETASKSITTQIPHQIFQCA